MSTRWRTLNENSSNETLESELLRYELGGVGGLLSKIAKGAGSIYDRVLSSLNKGSSVPGQRAPGLGSFQMMPPPSTAPNYYVDQLVRGAQPKQPFFRAPEAAQAQSDQNLAAAEQAGQMLQQQQQDALNAHVLDFFRRAPQVGTGGTLAQGRTYPMRVGGQHSAETSAQLSGECSDAGRRLEECKHSDHQRTHSRGERL